MPDKEFDAALHRIEWVIQRAREEGRFTHSDQATLMRGLRELHRVMSVSTDSDQLDPNRRIRYFIWNGLRRAK